MIRTDTLLLPNTLNCWRIELKSCKCILKYPTLEFLGWEEKRYWIGYWIQAYSRRCVWIFFLIASIRSAFRQFRRKAQQNTIIMKYVVFHSYPVYGRMIHEHITSTFQEPFFLKLSAWSNHAAEKWTYCRCIKKYKCICQPRVSSVEELCPYFWSWFLSLLDFNPLTSWFFSRHRALGIAKKMAWCLFLVRANTCKVHWL